MNSVLDSLERYFTGLRDKMLARSKHDYSSPVYIHGWRIVIPTKPNEMFSAYFLWPSVFGFFCLFLPPFVFAHYPYPVHSRFISLADFERLAGHHFMAAFYMMLDIFARATPSFVVIFNIFAQLILLYSLLTMYFWNRRARRLQANPPSEPQLQTLSPADVWPPPPRME